ncbi:MAG: 50S ribosomal protein L11 methyltransferase [Pseudomonadota bacterium]
MNDWIKLSIDIDPSHVDIWSDTFLDQGAACVDVADASEGSADEVPIFGEPGEDHQFFWHTTRVSALFEPAPNKDWSEWLRKQASRLDLPAPHCTLAFVDNQDWVTLTQAQFQPIRISSRLWIIPSWHQPAHPEAINLIVDPGMAFGTGTHPTTQLCLRWLDQNIQPHQTVLDYGCGSGILAIAAAKLGAKEIKGVDIDPTSLVVAQQNAQANQVSLETLLPEQLPLNSVFDCVVANILANPLRALAPLLSQHVAPHGTLLLSGLWREQAGEIAEHYKTYGFDLKLTDSEEGWALLVGTKNNLSSSVIK